MKEFGKVTRTTFILKYYDDVELRQSVEKLLSHIEMMNRFAKAVFFGNNQEFQVDRRCGGNQRGARKNRFMPINPTKRNRFMELFIPIRPDNQSGVARRIGRLREFN